MPDSKNIFLFSEGNAGMRDLLGGKGANLAEMTRIGLPVPPGLTITTAACNYYSSTRRFPDRLMDDVRRALGEVERAMNKRFGDPARALLVSVRSGAAISMPGMMDTILNLGLNDKTVAGLAAATGDERFAYDCYRRLCTMFGNVVMHIEGARFEEALSAARERHRAASDVELPAGALRDLTSEFKALIAGESGRAFPEDPFEQLEMAIRAVFESWNNPRAMVYRRINRIPDDLGTAVNVQAMVFGNMGQGSATGVLFTRNPSTGARELYGEYLANAQGEDVVAGIRTPRPIAALQGEMPSIYAEIARTCKLLEDHYRDLQDIEFTVESGRLYILQTRAAKRTAAAAVKAAWDMAGEGLITREQALLRIEPDQVTSLLHRTIDPRARLDVFATGLPASPGAASGEVVFDADRAEALGQDGRRLILVRPETTPDDIHGILAAQGILTSRGGMTCHAAIVARHMGKPCVVGCEALRIDLQRREFRAGDRVFCEGDVISIDGATGRVIAGEVPVVDPEFSPEFSGILDWADAVRRLGVEANADTPQDAARAREFGAHGIGLCRTEHMFMAPDRLPVVRAMIMAETAAEREAALARLLPMQQGDFAGILEAMAGYPVTIRLLDPPLHEFLPDVEELSLAVERLRAAREHGAAIDEADLAAKEGLLRKARALAEFNPMLGLRGCRLGILFPEIYRMQARAIFHATAALRRRGVDARPEVMIPLVGIEGEIAATGAMVREEADRVSGETGIDVHCPIGTMIELPRACLVADQVARHAEFFSFGTNDLTQTTFGFSRDDAEAKFLGPYLEQHLLPENPFAVLDVDGVGQLIVMAVEKGRKARPDLRIGICGEHGGDPRSIEFCHRAGLDYVSCSPFRVPVARLAAARARVRELVQETAPRGE